MRSSCNATTSVVAACCKKRFIAIIVPDIIHAHFTLWVIWGPRPTALAFTLKRPLSVWPPNGLNTTYGQIKLQQRLVSADQIRVGRFRLLFLSPIDSLPTTRFLSLFIIGAIDLTRLRFRESKCDFAEMRSSGYAKVSFGHTTRDETSSKIWFVGVLSGRIVMNTRVKARKAWLMS